METMGIAINMQRVFNPIVEAGTLRLQDSQIGNFNVAIDDLNVSVQNECELIRILLIKFFLYKQIIIYNPILFSSSSLCLKK